MDVDVIFETSFVGSVIIADNVIHPGCPDFLIYVRTAPKAGF